MPPNPQSIVEMASAFYDSCVLFTASDLGIFKKLADLGSADSNRLAEALKLNARGTRLLLDACVAVGLLEKQEETYRNTLESEAFHP